LNVKSLGLQGRARHWAMDATVGAAVALLAITGAHAALPDKAAHPVAAPLKPVAAAVVPAAAPVAEPVLIAFSEAVPGYGVVSPFGLRQLPWEAGGRLHEGVDIAAPSGAPVLAAADGVVTAAGTSESYGRYVEVTHAEGLKTFYAHLGAIGAGVAAGLAVKAGAPIGAIGSSGTSTGPHLHLEIRDAKGRPLNPDYFIGHSFATADDLPLSRAARVPRGVRIAHVSVIPASKRALMAAKAKGAEALDASSLGVEVAFESRVARKALVARIAAGQKADMSREEERPHATLPGVGETAPAPVDVAATPS